mgnify:CR=1 FL=1
MEHRKPNIKLYNVPWSTDEFNGMPYRLIGRSGLRGSNIGLGTWKVGYPETGDGARVNEKTALEIFDRAIELGVTFWDTANRYNGASGNSERVIGTWMGKNPDQRRNVVLATKLFGGMDGRTPNHSRLSRGNILESVYASLERLQVDYIDLLYFHAFDPITPIEESLAATEDLIRQDLVRHLGVSNFTIEQLSLFEANTSIRCRVIAVQNQFDILNGESPSYPRVLNYADFKGISFIAWSPLARGLLTERYLDLTKVGPGHRLYDEGTIEDINDIILEKLKKLAALAHELDLELNQLAIAYMLTLPGMGPVISSVSSIQQLESNAAAGKVILTDNHRERVKEILEIR